MGSFTHYLTVLEKSATTFDVRIETGSAIPAIQRAFSASKDLRYSPLLPAYLSEEQIPTTPPSVPALIAFFFALRPYDVLGKIRPGLSESERDRVFFTQGLASIVILDLELDAIHRLKDEIECSTVEIWIPNNGIVSSNEVLTLQDAISGSDTRPLELQEVGDEVIDVYIQQISASVGSLWVSYGLYNPEERHTLTQILKLVEELIVEYAQLIGEPIGLKNLKERNAIISGLVELSAALSYSVTQGTSGATPILASRSPFPHHSLLGVAGAVRALTKFTRYLESAFQVRSAADIIERQYSSKRVVVPASIPDYDSGEPYSFETGDERTEEFDTGGDFTETDDLPLLAHFSLRHGFKEAKFSLTAA